MAVLTIIAKWKAKPGAEDELYERCRSLVAPTRAEEGCINYDLHRSIEDPGTLMFYENWTTKPLWEQHINSPHISKFFSTKDDIVESWEIFQGEKVDA
jgi:quinol monooxygenase YgiN